MAKNNRGEQLTVMMEVAVDRFGKDFYEEAITFVASKIAGVTFNATSVQTVERIVEVEVEKIVKDESSIETIAKLQEENSMLKEEIARLKELLNTEPTQVSAPVITVMPTSDMEVVENISKLSSKDGKNVFNYGTIGVDDRNCFYKIAENDKILLAEVVGASFDETVKATKTLRAKYNLPERAYVESALSEYFSVEKVFDKEVNCLIKKMPFSKTYIGYIGTHTFRYTPGMNKYNVDSTPGIDACVSSRVHAGLDKPAHTPKAMVERMQSIVYNLVACWEAKQKCITPMPETEVSEAPVLPVMPVSAVLGAPVNSLANLPTLSDVFSNASNTLEACSAE